MFIRRPILWPLAVTVLSEFAGLGTPEGGARVYVTAAATVAPIAGPGFLEATYHDQPSDHWLSPSGGRAANAKAFEKAEDLANKSDSKDYVDMFNAESPLSDDADVLALTQALMAPHSKRRAKGPTEAPMSFESLLESNSSVSNLLELSDEMLENATQIIAVAAEVDAAHGKRLFPNSSLPRPAQNEPNPKLRRREEDTIKELADHSGKLQRLFEQLEADLVSEGGEDALDAHADPALHKELSMAGIDEDATLEAASLEQVEDVEERKSHLRQAEPPLEDESNFRYLITGLLVAVLCSVAGVGFCIYNSLLTPRPAFVDDTAGSTSDGSTSYVIRIVKARVEDLPSRAALAWQISVGAENPRPSRFTKDMLWDAPVDRLDVDVSDPREKISVAVLAASPDGLQPPATLATVEIPAAVLLAEARGNKEKVANASGDTAYVHEKRLALYPRGELVLDYSLIAFFHWYVGGEKGEGISGDAS